VLSEMQLNCEDQERALLADSVRLSNNKGYRTTWVLLQLTYSSYGLEKDTIYIP